METVVISVFGGGTPSPFVSLSLNKVLPPPETPPSSYWKEVAEERRKALYDVLQENEKVG